MGGGGWGRVLNDPPARLIYVRELMFREGLHGSKELVSFYRTECKKSHTLNILPPISGSVGGGQIPPLQMSLDVKE